MVHIGLSKGELKELKEFSPVERIKNRFINLAKFSAKLLFDPLINNDMLTISVILAHIYRDPCVMYVVLTDDEDRIICFEPQGNAMLFKFHTNEKFSLGNKHMIYKFTRKGLELYNVKSNITLGAKILAKLHIGLSKENMELADRSLKLITVHFDYNKSDIKPEFYPFLNRLAGMLLSHPNYRLIVQGHTDNIGRKEYNYELSLRRANEISKYLVNKGVDETRIIIEGYGEERPIANNLTEKGRYLNRRVEFKLLKE